MTVMQDVVPRPGLASGLFMNTYRGGAILAGPLVALGGTTTLGYGATFLAAAVVAAVSVPLLVRRSR
jgi:SET family sugar efflux transporter-like MFS transporter